jgi:hypothetical protein
MKGNLYLVSLFLIVIQRGYSQDKAPYTSLPIFISAGYASQSPVYVREYYDEIVNSYRYEGIPIPTQLEFGRTAAANAGMFFGGIEEVRVGFSIGYSYTPAYSNYKDDVGTLKVNGSAASLEISFIGEITAVEIVKVPVHLNVQLGTCRNSASITQELRFFDFPWNNYDSKWSASAWGVYSQFTVGVPVQLGNLTLGLEGGYRYSSCQVTDETIESSTGNYSTDDHWDIGQNGFIFLVSAEMNL